MLVAAESRRLGRTPVLMRFEDVDTSTSEDEESSDAEMEDDSSPRSNKRKAKLTPSRANKKLRS